MNIDVLESYISKMKQIGIARWVLLGLAGVLLLGSSYLGKSTGEQKTEKREMKERQMDKVDYKQKMEEELTTLIRSMKGVSNAKVMITLKSTEEKIVKEDTEIMIENDSGGEKKNSKYHTVIINSDGEEKPYVVKETYPQVEGVAVCVKGNYGIEGKSDIIRMIQALFQVDIHKISITEMK